MSEKKKTIDAEQKPLRVRRRMWCLGGGGRIGGGYRGAN